MKTERCTHCADLTGKCGDDSWFTNDGYGPLCEDCFNELQDYEMAIDLEDEYFEKEEEDYEDRS